jgi:hypothetical protein
MKVGGNKFFHWIGSLFVSIGTGLVNKHKSKTITNMGFEFVNPFTLMINFVVDNSDKYQIIIQGDYKDKYIEWSRSKGEDPQQIINDDRLFALISDHRSRWFKKN